jgi:ferritin-like metal-binding protein YciE
MAGRTQGERLEVIEQGVLRHSFQIENLEERFRTDLAMTKTQIRALEDRVAELASRVAVAEQRCTQMEKLLDEGRTRRWQVWLAFVGAALSATVALVIALVRRP